MPYIYLFIFLTGSHCENWARLEEALPTICEGFTL